MQLEARDPDTAAFEEMFDEHDRAVLAYALRRCANAADAEDAVAETFAIAWRRLARVPGGAEARPWLYGVCRRVLANQRRGEARRRRLFGRLIGHVPATHATATEGSGPARPAIEALGHVRDDDQELLRLVAWEGLRHAEIATVLGITANAVAIRVHRARARFELEFQRVIQEDDLKGLDRSRTSPRLKERMAGDRVRERPR